MTLRKLLALLLCLVMMLAAVGCGEVADTNDDDDDKPTKKSKTTVTTTQTGDGEVTTTTDFVTTTTQRDKDTTAETTTTTTTGGGTAAALPDDELILGDWEAAIELGKIMSLVQEQNNQGEFFDLSGVTLTMAYHFSEDGTAMLEFVVADGLEEELKAAFLEGMDAYLEWAMRETEYSSAEEYCEAMGYTSMEQLREATAEAMAMLSIVGFNEIKQQSSYRFEDGYLFFSTEDGEEEQYNYTLTATRLLLDYVSGAEGELGESIAMALMPLTFKKVG